MADGELDVLGDPLRLVDRIAVLRDRADDAEVVHLLEGAAAEVLEGSLATEDQDRRVRSPGVRNPRHAVGHAGAGRDRGDADRARVAARPGVGGVDRRLLVTHVDDLDPFVDAAVVEGHDVAAREGEDDLDTSLLEGLGRQLSAVKGHVGTPARRGRVGRGADARRAVGNEWGGSDGSPARREGPDLHDITGPEAGPSESGGPRWRTAGLGVPLAGNDAPAGPDFPGVEARNAESRWMQGHPPALCCSPPRTGPGGLASSGSRRGPRGRPSE